jgi:phosphoribosyl 1,2-cyclic phosphodiesterase
MTDHEILMELLKRVHKIALDTLPSCYVEHIPNPDVYYDAIEFIEDVMPELKEVSHDA